MATNQSDAQDVPGEFGPNDFHWKGGNLKPGLGKDHQPRASMGNRRQLEAPSVVKLRQREVALRAAERKASDAQAALEKRAADLAEREAALAAREAEMAGDDVAESSDEDET